MTLFYDYNMLSFVGIFDTEIFDICFSKSSKQVHKIIISKDFIWLSYNIHFVSAIIIIIFPLIMQQWIWKLQHPLPSPLTTGFWSSSKPKGGGGGRWSGDGGDWTFAWLASGNLNQKCQDFPLECTCYISFNVEVFKVDSSLSPAKGSEDKSAQGLGFKAWSMWLKSQLLIILLFT